MLLIGSWLRNRRRRKLCAEPFPDVWEEHLHHNAAFFSKLTPPQQAKLRDDLRVFIAEKDWEGCNGLKMSDEVQVTIAANACLLALELPEGMFDRVRTILVYPGDYVVPDRSVGPDGVVREGPSARHGEAWLRGPVILSWTNALEGGQNSRDGRNVVFHEFAHQLDMLDGIVDGMPPLAGKAQQQRWQQITRQAQAELHHDLRHGRTTLLDPYAATNAQEFFAVATECFFERSKAMRKRAPELYGLLSDYYRQDPAGRSAHG